MKELKKNPQETSGVTTHPERTNGSGEKVVVLQANHVLVFGVAGGNVFDVIEQRDHQLLVGLLGLPSLVKDEEPEGKNKNYRSRYLQFHTLKIFWGDRVDINHHPLVELLFSQT